MDDQEKLDPGQQELTFKERLVEWLLSDRGMGMVNLLFLAAILVGRRRGDRENHLSESVPERLSGPRGSAFEGREGSVCGTHRPSRRWPRWPARSGRAPTAAPPARPARRPGQTGRDEFSGSPLHSRGYPV